MRSDNCNILWFRSCVFGALGFAAACFWQNWFSSFVFKPFGFPAVCSKSLVFQLCVRALGFPAACFWTLGFPALCSHSLVFQLCVKALWCSSCVFGPLGLAARHVMYMMHCLLQASLNVQGIVDTQNRIFLCMQGHAIAFRSSCLLLGRLVECLATPG